MGFVWAEFLYFSAVLAFAGILGVVIFFRGKVRFSILFFIENYGGNGKFLEVRRVVY